MTESEVKAINNLKVDETLDINIDGELTTIVCKLTKDRPNGLDTCNHHCIFFKHCKEFRNNDNLQINCLNHGNVYYKRF